MTSDRWQRVQDIFEQALKLPHKERAAFLAKVCGDDAELRAEVESLLDHDQQAGSGFLRPPERDPDPAGLPLGLPSGFGMLEDPPLTSTEMASPPSDTPRRQIGPYHLREKLGEGGMGVVYRAEQTDPIKRSVAVKVIKPGMDTKRVIARFESERQALALMSHPNVCTVLDSGATEEGRPYFVMGYVKGEPITRYCDRHHLTTKERLELFIPVCQAVQHAHQKGIIHRDIKPSNILVAVEGGTPAPKVIDFGVAKATGQKLTERTLFTEQGQLIGTPEYMSPEQAEMTALDVDTRTDVYSLGVVLYELLVGAQPFDHASLRQAAYGEIQRIIREEEPPKPSTRLSSLGDNLLAVAKRRHTNPRALKYQLRGDIDWITMKAMEKDRTRRYATPIQLASDIARHMAGEPIEAGPRSTKDRCTRFVRKHRTVLNVFSSVAVLWPIFFFVLLSADKLLPIPKSAVFALATFLLVLFPLLLVILSIIVWRMEHTRHALANAILGVAVCVWMGLGMHVMRSARNSPYAFLDEARQYSASGQYADAAAIYERELKSLPSSNPFVPMIKEDLAEVLRRQKRFTQAEALLVDLLDTRIRQGRERWETTSESLAQVYDDWGKPEKREALQARMAELSVGHDQ